MVRVLLICTLLYGAFFLGADEVKVTAAMEGHYLLANQPLKGIISITHHKNDRVDIHSFKMNNAPLKVTFVQETQMSIADNLLVSFYTFTIPGQPKGLYVLPEIVVRVGDKNYQSVPSTYEVGDTAVQNGKTTNIRNPSAPFNPVLKFEGNFEAPETLYPGQKIRMYYRYTFNTNIELTDEKLPLLDAPNFKKIGPRNVEDKQEGDLSIREISQTVEAIKPGTFDFPTSKIEGYAYWLDENRVKHYVKPLLKAESSPLSITVHPFPVEGRPASFNGAIGPFSSFTTKLNSSSTVNVGDKLSLGFDLTGTGNVETAPLPELCCQPGLTGFFQQSDLPPLEKFSEDTKHFDVELRPLSESVKAVPSIEFSFFDPNGKSYGILHSDPIPIKVIAQAAPSLPSSEQPEEKSWKEQPPLTPIEINKPFDLGTKDFLNFWIATWWVFLLIPLAILLILLQKRMQKEQRIKKTIAKQITSEDIYETAMREEPFSARFSQLLNKAFMLRLVERGHLISTNIAPENLPRTGKVGEVRELLTTIEEKRYTGQEKMLDPKLLEQSRNLFNSL